MGTNWHTFEQSTKHLLRRFLLKNEAMAVSACERFISWDDGPDRIWFAATKNGLVVSAIILSPTGILYPVFGNSPESLNKDGLALLIEDRRVRSIQGQIDDVRICETFLERRGSINFERVDYTLMRLDSNPYVTSLVAGPAELIIRTASLEDAEKIFPLQAAYEIEEVLPPHISFKPGASRLALERTLARRIALVAEYEGQIVGKANTNARSFERDQIGGVYVLPEYRGQGIATRLVSALCVILNDDARGINLFVKQQNLPAQSAYKRVGFYEYGNYRISYVS